MSRTIMQVIGDASPLPGTTRDKMKKGGNVSMSSITTKDVLASLVPGLLLGGAGYFFWKKHRVLGLIGGLAVGSSAYPAATGKIPTALATVAVTGAGIGLSLKWKRHPALGYIGGAVGASAIALPALYFASKK